jgi:hypothetical protein
VDSYDQQQVFSQLPTFCANEPSAMSSRIDEAEFPGIPSTQEWREDLSATQMPLRKPQNAYITPQTSFTEPADQTEIDGFDIQAFVGAAQPIVLLLQG